VLGAICLAIRRESAGGHAALPLPRVFWGARAVCGAVEEGVKERRHDSECVVEHERRVQ